MEKYYLGMNIGGTNCSVALGRNNQDYKLKLLGLSPKFQTLQVEPYKMIDQLILAAKKLLKEADINIVDISGIGISCGGPLNSKEGLILSPPNLIQWDNIPITKIVSKRFKVPAWLGNDANAGALAEWFFGAGKNRVNLIFLTFGTGIGAGIIMNNQLIRGASDMAGEVGRIRLENFGPVGNGKLGSLEGFCSGGGIAQLAQQMILAELQQGHPVSMLNNYDLRDIDAKVLMNFARQGDELALKIVDITANYLGKGLAIIIDILNPELIIIGSIYTRSEDLLYESMQKSLQEEAHPLALKNCQIVKSELGEKIGEISALSVAIYNDQQLY